MIKERLKGVYLLDCFGKSVRAGFSGRRYDTSRRNDFLKQAGLNPQRLVLVKQVHSANLIWVSEQKKPSETCLADGMMTVTPGLVLGVLTADCVPVFFYDPEHHGAGVVHAGWRGLSQGIVRKMVQAFRLNLASNPGKMQIALGPGIRKCCYEVGSEFEDVFPEFYKPPLKQEGEKTGRMDLIQAVLSDLSAEGIVPEKIHDCGFCTSCRNEDFFSYRRERKIDERILSVIALEPEGKVA